MRQIQVWGVEAQETIMSSTVLVAGLGGLGSAASLYLAAAGVRKLVLVDHDVVKESDLNRQVLHWTRDLGALKVESAEEKLRSLNPDVNFVLYREKLESLSRVEELVREVDVVVDALDNWTSRFLLNRACVNLGKPFVHAAVEGLKGWLTVIHPPHTPCLACILSNPPEKGSVPVAGPLPGILGCMQALETLKVITGFGKTLTGRLLFFDGLEGSVEIYEVRKKVNCPACS
ncbi:MAG: HesA/MoeB/ThiF family protein [Thermofilaceae archaeon]|nr:HesA/MoeB/ThiF family protein [Thermofilaceae archaeon]